MHLGMSEPTPSENAPHPSQKMIGRRIREAREKRDLTQPQLATRIGSTQKSVSSWETGRTEISLLDILRICNALDVSADYLLCRVDRVAEFRLRSEPMMFIDRVGALSCIETATSLKDLESLLSVGVTWGAQVLDNWELVDRAEWEKVEATVRKKLLSLGEQGLSWVREVMERRRRDLEQRND